MRLQPAQQACFTGTPLNYKYKYKYKIPGFCKVLKTVKGFVFTQGFVDTKKLLIFFLVRTMLYKKILSCFVANIY